MRSGLFRSWLVALAASSLAARALPPDPCAGIFAKSHAPSSASPRVNDYVPGLYASISNDIHMPAPFRMETKMEGEHIVTRMGAGGATAKFKRSLSPDRKTFVLSDAVRSPNFPGFLNFDGVQPLVAGRGIPTQIFTTLHQMRVLGVESGSLRRLVAESIFNEQTALELVHREPIQAFLRQHPGAVIPDELIAREILTTHTGLYMQTIATQSGHRVTKVRVHGTKMYSEWGYGLQGHAAELAKNTPEGAKVPMNFTVEFDLEPLR